MRIRLAVHIGLVLAGLSGGAAAETIPCPDLERRFELLRSGGTHLEMVGILFLAADSGCEPLAVKLLDGGVPSLARDREGNTVLTRAAKAGQSGVVRLLIERGADLEQRNIQGATALFAATVANRTRIVQQLAEAGARIDAPGRSGVSPLSAAAFNGNDRLVAWFLARGADPRDMDGTGKSAVVYAAARGFTATVARLLDAGVAVDRRYGNDLTLLMWAAGHANDVPETDGIATVELVLARGGKVDDVDNRGRTALMMASEQGHAAIVKRLVAAGANTTLRDRDGRSTADLAASDAVRAALAP
jgi:ankyrin repeat protein